MGDLRRVLCLNLDAFNAFVDHEFKEGLKVVPVTVVQTRIDALIIVYYYYM